MTYFNTGYSSIEEAWGEPYLSPNLQKKKKKKSMDQQINEDPICELYAMGNNHYQDSDIVNFANQYYDKHDKPKFQKPMMEKREPQNPKTVDIRDGSVYAYGAPYDQDVQKQVREDAVRRMAPMPQQTRTYEDDAQIQYNTRDYVDMREEMRNDTGDDEPSDIVYEERPTKPSSKITKTLRDTQEFYMSEEDPEYFRKDSAFMWMDMMLYIISGIILIFMMEQFVKVGMLLH